MAKSKWIKGLGAVVVAGIVVVGGLYLYGSSSSNIPPATVDFAKLDAKQFDELYKRGEHAFSARSKKSECDGQPYSFAYPLPAYGAAIFKFN